MSFGVFPPFPIKNRPLFFNSLRFNFRFLLSRPLQSNYSYSFSPFTPMASIHSDVDNEVALARRLWNKFRGESFLALYTPFMVCLASGYLLIETFRHYVARDVHFLKAFVKAYESAEECADDDDAKLLILDLRKVALEVLKLHKSFVQAGRLTSLKSFITKLEIDFFYALSLAQSTVVYLTREHNPAEEHLIIFSDFDLTCMIVDSSAILAEIAIVTAPKPDQNLSENQIARMSSTDLRNTWGVLSGLYTEEYEQVYRKYDAY